MDDVLGYSGRRCIVTGAASGMGEATARILVDLGAEVHAVDIRKPEVAGLASFSETDLSDPAAIAKTADAIGGIVNNLFNCAGLPNNFPGLAVMSVNFCGLRELTERVIPLMIDGAAISSIASVAGMAWQGNQEKLAELLATPDFASAQGWCEA
ncbi:MAG TPA: SDR family NAD(P)-dependent oxidoreductase, partial [Acidimicrobiia bacterium]